MFSIFRYKPYKPFFGILLFIVCFLCGYQSQSSQKPESALQTIMVQVNRMNQQYTQYAEHIKGCKPGKFVLVDPIAFRALVNSYITKGNISPEEAEHIYDQNETTYIIVGLKGNTCRYTMKKKMQPDKTWQCSISAKELTVLYNFFKAVSENQTNISIPNYPITTEVCK